MADELKWVSTTNMLVVNDGKILVIKRPDNEESFPGWYILPGGKQEPNETSLDAAIRETVEETGIKVENPKLKVFATHLHDYRNRVYLVYIFMAEAFSGDIVSGPEGEVSWVKIEDLLNSPKLYPDLKRHIKMILDEKDQELKFTFHRFNADLQIIEEK